MKILCIIGESGSGKTTAAEYIEDVYDIPMIQSYTDRKPRYKGENGHTFITKQQFDLLNKRDMIAYTEFGGNRYCCLHKDVKDVNTYVIDDYGYKYLKRKYNKLYEVKALRISRDEKKRRECTSKDRIQRDKDKFFIPLDYYDYIVSNNCDLLELYNSIDFVAQDFFGFNKLWEQKI